MIKKRQLKKKQIGKQYLKAGAAVGRVLGEMLLDIGYVLIQPWKIEGWSGGIPAYRIRQELKRMRDRGWIHEAEKNGKKFLKLTQKGRLELLYKKMKITTNQKGNTWDRRWRLIMFDVPEAGKKKRKSLRKLLKTIGFYAIQKSVYIYPYAIPADAVSYLKESGLWKYIRFAQIDTMEYDKDIKQYFCLK